MAISIEQPGPYIPQKPEEGSENASVLVKWCRDCAGPAHDYFEIYRYTGFVSYLIVDDPNNLSEADSGLITENSVDFYGRPEDLFFPNTPMYNHVLKNSELLNATANTYYVDKTAKEEEYYTYLIAGIREEERTDGLSSVIPVGSEPNGWYRTFSYLFVCAINTLPAKDLYVTNGEWDDTTWTTSEFCETPYGSFSYAQYTQPGSALAETYKDILVP